MPEEQVIGVIGLGVMGKPMASRLVKAGFDVMVHNRSREPVRELEMAGARAAASTADLAGDCDIVITMLPDSPDVESVVLGSEGVMESARPGALVIDMSTIAPATARRIAEVGAERGIDTLDAPVSGGQRGAVDGTLSIMCGGTKAAVERAQPVFDHLGTRVVHVGSAGAGQMVKACNQIVVGITLQAVAEALVLGAKAGVEPEAIIEALLGGAARCWALEVRAPHAVRGDYEPGFRSRLHHKDLGIALAAGAELGVALPVSAAVHQFLGALIAIGRGDRDHSALLTLIEDLSGHHLNGGSASR